MAQWAELKAETGIVIPLVKKRLMQKIRQPRTSRHPGIYPSELSRDDWCPLATYYRLTGRREPARNQSFTLTNVFAEGNAIHDKWQGWLKKDLWGDWRCPYCQETVRWTAWEDLPFCSCCVQPDEPTWEYREVSLEDKDLMLRGRADGALWPSTLIEFKSVGIGTIRREAPKLLADHTNDGVTDIDRLWRNINRPLLSHVKQVNLYLYMAELQDETGTFDQAAIVYEFKPNQQAKEWTVKISQEILVPMLDAASRLVYAVQHEQPPACVKGAGCGECKPWEDHGNG